MNDCEQGIELDADISPDIYYIKGLIYMKMNVLKEAIEEFDKSIALTNRMRNFSIETVANTKLLCQNNMLIN